MLSKLKVDIPVALGKLVIKSRGAHTYFDRNSFSRHLYSLLIACLGVLQVDSKG